MAQWAHYPKNRDRRQANNFADGLDTSTSPFFVSENTIIKGYGWDFDEYPAVKVRKGRTAFGSSGSGVTRLLANYSNVHLVRAVGTKLQYNSNGTTWTDISGTYADVDWDYANFDVDGKALLLLNPTNGGYYWNGSTITPIEEMPKGKFITTDNLRTYVAGVEEYPDRFYYSAFQDALDFTTPENSGEVQYYTASGQPITAIHAFGTGVWVFKEDSYAILYHTGDSRLSYRLQPISNNIGCVAYRTLIEVGPYLMWLGRDNVYIGAGDGAKEIGKDIRGILETINPTAVQNSFSFGTDTRYYLCIPTGSNTQPDICLVYDYLYRKWLPYSVSLGSLRWSAKMNGISYAGNNSGQTFKMNDSTADNGTEIPWRIQGRPFDDDVKEAEKELYEMHLQGYFPSGTTLKVEVAPDDEGINWFTIDYDPVGSSGSTQNKNLIVPLDNVPLCHFYTYRITGTGPAVIQEVQRYSRIMPVMH